MSPASRSTRRWWLNVDLDTGTLSVLGHEHDHPVIQRWNAQV